MKYCPKCGVNVHRQQTNCPLCGTYLDENNNNDKCAVYVKQDEIVTYPVLKVDNTQPFFKYKFNKILIVIALIATVTNILFDSQHHWTYFVVCSVIYAICCIMPPINRKQKIDKILRQVLFWSTAYAIAMEIGICNWSYTWFTMEYVLPWLYVGIIVALDFLIIFKRNTDRRVFSMLILTTFYAIAPQIVFWIAQIWQVKTQTLICVIVFLSAIVNMLVAAIVCNRSLKEEMERNLNI